MKRARRAGFALTLFAFSLALPACTGLRSRAGTERGIASWYGPGFHHRRTANGEVFDQDALTAAHQTLPFNSLVEVRNLDNGKAVRVRINDRGPFVRGRVIDLSRGAARAIDMLGPGTARVEIRILRSPKGALRALYAVQVGAFEDRDRAVALCEELRATCIVATCQDERSQLKNRNKAMAVLRARLLDQEVSKQREEIDSNRRSQVGTGDRSEKIRTYNYPQDRMTDHRIGYTRHSLPSLLDGDLDDVIDALQEHEQAEKLEAQLA